MQVELKILLMSYERTMLESLQMPPQKQIEKILLQALFKHNGIIKEFGGTSEIVTELADQCGLNE